MALLKSVPGKLSLVLLPILVIPAFCRTYSLDLRADFPAVKRGELDLGGKGPNGGSIEVNSFYLEQNGRPFVPVIGEFHFSRYPSSEWEEELRKMKAGGINTVATYVFWNMHERSPDHFDWSGDLDLRRFIELTQKVGLQMVLRVGPFDHGEIRNGGLPDWLYGQPNGSRNYILRSVSKPKGFSTKMEVQSSRSSWKTNFNILRLPGKSDTRARRRSSPLRLVTWRLRTTA